MVNFEGNLSLQCNLDLVTLNLVTTCDLVTISQRPFFLIYYIKSFDLVTLWDLVTVFAETKSVTKSRLHCTFNSENQEYDALVQAVRLFGGLHNALYTRVEH